MAELAASEATSVASHSLDELCINNIRVLAADVVQRANSGHPGAPIGLAPVAHLLFGKYMKFNPRNPRWMGRDRFVLSNGHACALQYIMLHLCGYDLTMNDLMQFRQFGSKTPGHPENLLTAGVEVSTGPLGQGISNAVGMAIAESHLAARYNKPDFSIFNNFTYVICGDGCMQEGIASEACSLAGHLQLHKLIVLYDDNHITIDGPTELSFSEDVCLRFESYGWHVQHVTNTDNMNLADISRALDLCHDNIAANYFAPHKPHFIKVTSIIGYGSLKQGSEETHGAPLGEADIRQLKTRFGFDPLVNFHVAEQVGGYYHTAVARGEALEADYNLKMAHYRLQYVQDGLDLDRMSLHNPVTDLTSYLPTYRPGDKPVATRKSSMLCLEAISHHLPELIIGSADLTPSNLTLVGAIKASGSYSHFNPAGRYNRYGVREHGMSAVANGIFAYGILRPMVASFLNFIGYALGAVRLSALSRFGVVYIMTHDSIFLGEDGPTHQPIEMLSMLRSIPDLFVYRPADGLEVGICYHLALLHVNFPSVICLSRQDLPVIEGGSEEGVRRGAYIVSNPAGGNQCNVILIGSGSEVSLCVEAAKLLTCHVRVISMPCQELYEEQGVDYKLSLFPDFTPILSVEASSSFGWQVYSHAQVSINQFGASAPFKALAREFGFTPQVVAERATELMALYQPQASPARRIDFSRRNVHQHESK